MVLVAQPPRFFPDLVVGFNPMAILGNPAALFATTFPIIMNDNNSKRSIVVALCRQRQQLLLLLLVALGVSAVIIVLVLVHMTFFYVQWILAPLSRLSNRKSIGCCRFCDFDGDWRLPENLVSADGWL